MAEPPEPSAPPSAPGAGDAWHRLARTFDAPARYVIRIEGALSPDWSERLGGLCIAAVPGAVPVTELAGALADQAALLGVLTTLYDLGFPLLAVVRGPEVSPDAQRPGGRAQPGLSPGAGGPARRPGAGPSGARPAPS